MIFRAGPGSTRPSFLSDNRGTIAVMSAFLLPIMIATVGLVYEFGQGLLIKSQNQRIADAAAYAGALAYNSIGSTSSMTAAALAVAKLNGVSVSSATQSCPPSSPTTPNLYVCLTTSPTGDNKQSVEAMISSPEMLVLAPVLKVLPNGGLNVSNSLSISSSSYVDLTGATSYCLVALAGSGAQGITSNGAPNANLQGCNIMSNTGMTCNGHNLNANEGNAHGTDNGCGNIENSNVRAVSDPYSYLASDIPGDTCNGSYPQESGKKGSPLPSSNQLSGSYFWGSQEVLCGDQQLVGNTTINNTVLVIENGQLDTNGYTLTGSNLTLVFSGSNSSSYQHTPTGGGVLDIAAPTSGTWSGIAIYQNPALTNNVNVSAAGNSPTWNISGLVYLPHSTVTMSGAVNKSSSGATCFELVVDNITINGTGSIFANDTQCNSAGLNQISSSGGATLVN